MSSYRKFFIGMGRKNFRTKKRVAEEGAWLS